MSNKHAEIVRSLNKQWNELPISLEIPEIYTKHPTAELVKALTFEWNEKGRLNVRCKRPTFFLSSDKGRYDWEHNRVTMLPFRNNFNKQ